jgi:hypothetical protein
MTTDQGEIGSCDGRVVQGDPKDSGDGRIYIQR